MEQRHKRKTKSKRSKVKSKSFLLQTRSLVISADSLAIAAARRTETTARPVAAINPAGSPSTENYFDGRPFVGYTLYSVYARAVSFRNETAWLIGLYAISRFFDQHDDM